MSEYEVNYIRKCFRDLQVSEAFSAYSGVEIRIDDETSVFEGSRSGRVLSFSNPWGTRVQAQAILARLRSFVYQPFEAADVLLDPAAELGDAINANGLYSGVYALVRRYNGLMPADVKAPQDEEIDHEYPFEPKIDRETARRFAAVESEFQLQSNQIAAKVSQTGGSASSFGWQLVSDHFSLFSGSREVFRVDASGATVAGVIRATSGTIGGFNIGAQAIWNNISDFNNPGGLSTGVYMGTDGIRLGNGFAADRAGNVTMNNLTANNARLEGTLTVGGAQITADTLRRGAQSAYSNGSAWSRGAGYGDDYNAATQASPSRWPSFFQATNLKATSMLTVGGIAKVGSLWIGERSLRLITKTISGTTINYLGY